MTYAMAAADEAFAEHAESCKSCSGDDMELCDEGERLLRKFWKALALPETES